MCDMADSSMDQAGEPPRVPVGEEVIPVGLTHQLRLNHDARSVALEHAVAIKGHRQIPAAELLDDENEARHLLALWEFAGYAREA